MKRHKEIGWTEEIPVQLSRQKEFPDEFNAETLDDRRLNLP